MGPFVRIALRYAVGALIIKGIVSPEMGEMLSNDPEISMAIEIGLGVAIGALVEGWYYLARRFGWAK